MEHKNQYKNEDKNISNSHSCGHKCIHHKKMHGPLLVVVTLLSVYLLTLAVSEVREWRYIGSGITPTNTISVEGEGEVFAVPDTGVFSFSVIKEGKTADVVQENAAKVANKAIAYLKEKEGIIVRKIVLRAMLSLICSPKGAE